MELKVSSFSPGEQQLYEAGSGFRTFLFDNKLILQANRV